MNNIQDILDDVYKNLKGNYGSAKTADYIPILKNMDPEIFQISVYPVENNKWGFPCKEFSVGEFKDDNNKDIMVTIQSVSKVFSLAKAIKVRHEKNRKKNNGITGVDDINKIIGVEESFLGFNDINAHKLLNGSQGVPFTINPYINAGAIAVVSLVTPKDNKSTILQLTKNMVEFSGKSKTKIPISLATYKSEMQWIQTNKKLAHKLKDLSEKFYNQKKGNIRKFKYFQDDSDTLGVDKSLSNYTALCSTMVNSKILAYMTYTLANGGVNLDGKRVILCSQNKLILSSMTFGGMYNSSGQWHQKVGIPMKSGVGGAIIAVIPGQMAISVVSPPLDKYGNSEIGGNVILNILNKLKYHIYGNCNNLVIPRLLKKKTKKNKTKGNNKLDLELETNVKKIENILSN
jgi:glutaminase